ncbi:MAG: TIGR04086 family membrane protein [Actinomycetota bacterium]|nr:TIGR04086 family membrane protein [Actinomycetota bacterium]
MNWTAVRAGAALALAVALATLVAVELVDLLIGLRRGSNWIFAFYALVLAGLVAGGRHAARQRASAPVVHGLAAALAAYVVVALLAVILRLATDRDLDPVALAFNALMAASAGILGGLLADRSPARQ